MKNLFKLFKLFQRKNPQIDDSEMGQTLYRMLKGSFEPSLETDHFNNSFYREVASETLIDDNPDYVVLNNMKRMMYETLKSIRPYDQDFEGLKFYGIGNTVILNHIISQIKSGQLCASTMEFNDAVDPLYTVFAKLLQKGSNKIELRWYKLLEQLTANIRISCLCNKTDRNNLDSVENLLMWAHYADHHKGICVRYMIPHNFQLIDDNNERIILLKPVIYKDKKISVKNITLEDAFYLKSSQWSYENEYRVLYFSEALTNSQEDRFVTLGGVRILSVYLGAKISKENKAFIMSELAGTEIPVYQMKYSKNDVLRIQP